MRTYVFENYEEMSHNATILFAEKIAKKPEIVLGLATGSTPLGLYAGLCAEHKKNNLDFSRVVTYNLDEYYPISRNNDQSYYYFMHENLFKHINIDLKNVHLPNGETENPEEECKKYDKAVYSAGVDIQLLGAGNNGHIGFNEPAAVLESNTHVTTLTENTITANARFFASPDDVPRKALTMGMGTIMSAKTIIMLISGKNKAPVLAKMLSGKIDPLCPATFLNLHPDVVILTDKDAANR